MRDPYSFSWQVTLGTSVLVFLGLAVAEPARSQNPVQLRKDVQFYCEFERSPTECGFHEQAKVPGRATIVPVARSGRGAVRLHTEPGDTRVNGSGDWVRNDLMIDADTSACDEGREAWWAHSVLFPDDYAISPHGGVVMDFHHSGSRGNANFHFNTTGRGNLRLHGFGGSVERPMEYKVELEQIRKNKWYDMVYFVRWSSSGDGFMHAWMNGRKVLTHRGPTLYAGQRCYLKLANYHNAPEPSSVIHDRVVRGSTAASVSLTPLEGVRED
jgi:hypothetical protein